jgi:hypothetical protein
MGHDEDKNNFGGGTDPVSPTSITPNPRASIAKNRIGMRPARNFSAQDELNRISGVATQTQTAGGDIVLNNGVKKKSNKIIIAIILGLAVMAILCVVLFVMKRNTSIVASDSNFVKYLLNGDGDIKTTEKREKEAILADYINDSNRKIYPFTFYNLSTYSTRRDEKIEKYFSNIRIKYEEYKEAYSGTGKEAQVKKLGTLLELVEKNVDYMKNREDIINKYKDNPGLLKQNYKEYFVETDIEDLKNVSTLQIYYYENEIAYAALYDSVGCLKGNVADMDCMVRTGNINAIDSSIKEESDIGRTFNDMLSSNRVLNHEIIKTLVEINDK